jgi:hypothetical protein
METYLNELGIDDNTSIEERKKIIKNKFFELSKKGDHENLAKIIEDETLNLEELEDKKWTGLQWAVVNGHAEVVKLILERQDELGYRNKTREQEEIEAKAKKRLEIKDLKKNEFDDIFKKPPNSESLGKYNSLHWAAYKGYIRIVSLLIKFGYDPLAIDNVGNTSIHQAAASNKKDLFKIFMGLGLDLEIKNDREHMPIDLTANEEIRKLINKSLTVKICQLCPTKFDFFNKRYLCSISEDVVCSNCCVKEYLYENPVSKEKDIIQCRCKNCHSLISETEKSLNEKIKSNNLKDLTDFYNKIKHDIQICCKQSAEAEVNINRLEREKKISEHLNSLKTVENHKTIEKSVFLLEEMIKDAKNQNIQLDLQIIEKSYLEKNRLLAEKELRKVISNLTVQQSSYENLKNLDEKLQNANLCMVDEKYINASDELRKKIQLNLDARELLELFSAYPLRDYPEVESNDPKKKSNFKIK